MSDVLNRFLRYVQMESTSLADQANTPSSPGQMVLGRALAQELTQLGAQDVLCDDHAYVYGRIPATAPGCTTIALIAHLDTVDAVPGRNVQAHVVEYTGQPLALDASGRILLSEDDFPSLARWRHERLVVTDGNTILGADDKAGVAQIMTAAAHLLANPRLAHGDVWVVFTPDEEIGHGADLLDLEKISAAYGYTMDGGPIDEIEFENFNAASAKVVIHGRNIHPGSAKNKMRNACRIAMQFHALLPGHQVPEHTEGHEGFFHLQSMQGTEEQCELHYILRDHDAALLAQKKQRMQLAAEYINSLYGPGCVEIVVHDSYRNMREMVEQNPAILERAVAALAGCGITAKYVPIRGGTDGARLSFRGLPCPNLGTGGENGHSVFEYVPVSQLEKMTEVLIRLVCHSAV